MTPRISISDSATGFGVNAECKRQCFLARNERVRRTNNPYLFVSQFSVPHLFAMCRRRVLEGAQPNCICHVHLLRACVNVAWVAAKAIAATVAQIRTFGWLTVGQGVSPTMRGFASPFSVCSPRSKRWVVRFARTVPWPAFIRAFANDLWPKASFRRLGDWHVGMMQYMEGGVN